jgi:hypothetical protein
MSRTNFISKNLNLYSTDVQLMYLYVVCLVCVYRGTQVSGLSVLIYLLI